MKIRCQSDCWHRIGGYCSREKVWLKQEGLRVVCRDYDRKMPEKDTTTIFYYHYNDNLWT
ncbi:hypothetical protein ciss_03850 [Carboxydothermus islandicus]|uniref:DUF1540 domain-containing protein n=1 Tax=Carboxydothermus islandicus TaxID=661089 RepID=A0A1L8CZW1_9THEO|nr:hypothetical protein [Carboxydothermus islandicus]GAV24452.1 hypothetical protein ciss_03850 [Carboxydothermus islandicus]